MSAGHIYNYFESKEEIIEAIVEQNTAESMALIDEMQSGEADPAEAVLSQLGRGLDLVMDGGTRPGTGRSRRGHPQPQGRAIGVPGRTGATGSAEVPSSWPQGGAADLASAS